MRINKKIKKIALYTVLFIFLLALFPAFLIFNKIRNDYPLREYIKDNYVSELSDDVGLYMTNDSENIQIHTLQISLSDSAINDLNSQIDSRILKLNSGEANLLGTSKWDYVKATAIYDADTLDLKMRIRGDMPSNYNQGISKATFRINVKGEQLLLGKKKLSVIRPELESGYYGFLFYKCFKDEGFLSNHIEIIRLEINGEYVGLRFLQEGFSKELVESSFNREGPILRFKDDCVDSEGRYNEYDFPELEAYKENKTLKTPGLAKNYARAISKYEALIKGTISVEQCFNVDDYAKYYALCDVFLAHHSNICQNIKLYFNPINDKFEPIAWDPSSYNRFDLKLPIFKGHNQRFGEICNNQREYPIHYLLSKSDQFLEQYTLYLHEYSNSDVFIKMISEYSVIIEQTKPELFRQNFQNNFDPDNFTKTINSIRSDFRQKQQLHANYYIQDSLLSIRSLSNLPLIIDSLKYNDTVVASGQIISPNGFIEMTIESGPIDPTAKKIKVYSKVLGTNYTAKYKTKLFYSADHEQSSLFNESFDSSLFIMDFENRIFKLNKKNITISNDLFVPDFGMTWVIEPGTVIELAGSNIVCESNLSCIGTAESPILIKSYSTGGIIVKNNDEESQFINTAFQGLSSPSRDNWFLTGAVTFYNTKVLIDSCFFKDNKSEDALNLVSCEFKINNSELKNCMSDALDIDFGNGEINNITVFNSKNDALDFSGAKIEIDGARLCNVGDKALSGGEKSSIIAQNVTVDSAFIGIASKDLSIVKLRNLVIRNTKHSSVAYQKKSQFGKSQIIIANSDPIPSNHIIEMGCTYIVNGEIVKANSREVYKMLYPPIP